MSEGRRVGRYRPGRVRAALRQARTELAQLRFMETGGAEAAEAAIALAAATKTFPSGRSQVTALDNFTLDTKPGQFVSVIGPAGCGKTTLLQLLAGLIQPDTGTVQVGGKAPSLQESHGAAAFQNPMLWPHKTVFENVAAVLSRHAKFPDAVREKVSAVLPFLQLSGLEDRYPVELSAGERQRVTLARVLASERKLWLLDDPLSQLDAGSRATLRGEIKSRQQRSSATCLYVTTDVAEALAVSDTLVVMEHGRLLQSGTPQEIYARPASRAVAAALGPVTFVSGTVGEIRMGVGCIDAGPDLRLEMPVPAGMKAGDGVEVLIRPENVRLTRLLAPPKNGARGKVETHAFLGNLNMYEVRLASGLLMRAQTHPAQRFAVRDEISIEIDVGQCNLFRVGGGSGSKPAQRPEPPRREAAAPVAVAQNAATRVPDERALASAAPTAGRDSPI